MCTNMLWPEWSDTVRIGAGYQVDSGVLLGYPAGREIANTILIVGPNARIRSGTVLYAGSTIGANLETGHGVVIREENQIGEHLNIWNQSTIDYGCIIGAYVKIHCNVYIAQFTTIEDDVFIAPGVVTANDPHPLCGRCMRGPTIQRGARIGARATLLPHVLIGEHALIGAGSLVTHDIPPYSVAYGSPARVVKWVDELSCTFGQVEHPYLTGLDVRAREHTPSDV